MEMPCGEHEGTEINQLPDDYLNWVAENWEDDEIREVTIMVFLSLEEL